MGKLKKYTAAALLLTTFLFFTACSSQNTQTTTDTNASGLTSNQSAKQGQLDQKIIKLATSERVPYIGESLPDGGYVAQVVKEAFKRTGYNVEIQFFPTARASVLAEQGAVDGVMPVYFDETQNSKFVFSEPFQGDSIGLLKRKDLKISYEISPKEDMTKALKSLSSYRFGVLNGFSVSPDFDNADFLQKESVDSNEQNLLKLDNNRVDLITIDKYTAADIMTLKFPQLIGKMDFLEPILSNKPFSIAFSKNTPDYERKVRDFNKGLEAMKADGTLDTIINRNGLIAQRAPVKGKIKLVIATVSNNDMLVMQELSKEYMKQHPNIELDWKVLEENTLRTRLLSDISISAGQFDIMTISSYEAPIWAKQGWLVPLRSLPASYDVQDLLTPIKNSLSVDNTLYALPFYGESTFLYYRKDLLEKAGLTMPKNPTYDDIMKIAAAIHDPQNGIYGIGLRGLPGWGENMAYISTLVNTFGGCWFDRSWNPQIDTPEWKNALTFYKEILTNYGPPNPTANGYIANLKLFSEGHLGIWLDATVAAGTLYDPKQSVVSGKVAITNAPVQATAKGSHWLYTWAFAIPDSSSEKQAALDFITWATSKEYISLVASKKGWVAVPPGTRKSTYANPSYQAAAPFSKAVLEAIESANPNDPSIKSVPYTGIQCVSIPEFSGIATQMGHKMSKILTGEASVDEVLKESQTLAVEQMQASGYIK